MRQTKLMLCDIRSPSTVHIRDNYM